MSSNQSINDIAAKSLGSDNSYAVYTDTFDPSLLVPMPRALARNEYGITGKEFTGFDVWHCHESTFLLNNGIPVAGTLKIIYPSDSEYMVESKSIKLYLNTYDMCKMGYTIDGAIKNYENQILKDLCNILKTTVRVYFHKNNADQKAINPVKGYEDIYDYLRDKMYYMEDIQYNGDKTYNITEKNNNSNSIKTYYPVKLSTNVLRSRCRHTKQKDTGSAYIYFVVKPGYKINVENVLRQILQLREKNEFHEFCAEVLYTKFVNQEGIQDVMVSLLYARRGSLDINPVRTSNENIIPDVMIKPELYTKKTMGQ
jgi:7-cyano-7-deazaguanine reductase